MLVYSYRCTVLACKFHSVYSLHVHCFSISRADRHTANDPLASFSLDPPVLSVLSKVSTVKTICNWSGLQICASKLPLYKNTLYIYFIYSKQLVVTKAQGYRWILVTVSHHKYWRYYQLHNHYYSSNHQNEQMSIAMNLQLIPMQILCTIRKHQDIDNKQSCKRATQLITVSASAQLKPTQYP